ncbi:hypothetical protein B296_00010020 [Ensete ventricosum]|uniref:Uncharacterized protein n=1 Tax=Ensete ventricosum TaxID=4639 RepID=A0A427B275_ENSVE|nr:hypothetical protein B296_00010020 [Ensete ventricosum]
MSMFCTLPGLGSVPIISITGALVSPLMLWRRDLGSRFTRSLGSASGDGAYRPEGPWARKSHHEGEKSKARSSKGKEPAVATEEAPSPQSRLKSVKDIYNIHLREDGCDYHAILVGNRPEQASDVALEVDLAPLTHGTRIWHDERASMRYLRGTQIPRLAVDLYTLLSEVLMDKATKTMVLIELLKMTWAKDQFWVNLPRVAVEDYKKSPNFEMGLVWMGRVLLQYNYQLVLAWLRARHLKLEIEPDPFT